MNIAGKSVLTTLLLILITCFTSGAQAEISPSTALKRYLKNGDKNYKLEVKETFEVADVTVYNLLLTSHKWNSIKSLDLGRISVIWLSRLLCELEI